MTGPAIEVSDLSAGYGPVTILRNVNLLVEPGEVVALLGPNGAGKTTTLLAISGLISIHGGAIKVLGAAPPKESAAFRIFHRGVVHVPENRGLFAQLTARQNLLLGPGVGREGVGEAVELMPELGALLDRRAGLLSGGEQQMLALARALIAKPKVLLIDEMSLGLAPVIVERLLPIARKAADGGAAVLLVEQHTDLALLVSDRAYVMTHGEIVTEGEAGHLRSNRQLLDDAFFGVTPD